MRKFGIDMVAETVFNPPDWVSQPIEPTSDATLHSIRLAKPISGFCNQTICRSEEIQPDRLQQPDGAYKVAETDLAPEMGSATK